jgi:hypothetical protein
VSDVAIAKICRKLEIPLPGRGYWARKKAGYAVERLPLPPAKRGQPVRHDGVRFVEPPEPPLARDALELVQRDGEEANRITISESLRGLHPLVRMSASCLRRARSGDSIRDLDRCLDMSVGRASIGRALRIMDALLKALESRGFEVDVTEPENPDPLPRHAYQRRPSRTGVRIGASFVEFCLLEGTTRRVLGASGGPPAQGARPEKQPNGKLSLVVDAADHTGRRPRCDDLKAFMLEDQINAFIVLLIKAAEAQRLAAIDAEEERQRELAAEREREAGERQHEAWKLLVADLDERIAGLEQARKIRALMQQVSAKDQPAEPPQAALGEWLKWADWHAERFEKRALEHLTEHKCDGPFNALYSRFGGWQRKKPVTTADLVDVVVFNPYRTGKDGPDPDANTDGDKEPEC